MTEQQILDSARANISSIKSWVTCIERDINAGNRQEAANCVESLELELEKLRGFCLEMNDDEILRY